MLPDGEICRVFLCRDPAFARSLQNSNEDANWLRMHVSLNGRKPTSAFLFCPHVKRFWPFCAGHGIGGVSGLVMGMAYASGVAVVATASRGTAAGGGGQHAGAGLGQRRAARRRRAAASEPPRGAHPAAAGGGGGATAGTGWCEGRNRPSGRSRWVSSVPLAAVLGLGRQ
jgi:hypothetical protein